MLDQLHQAFVHLAHWLFFYLLDVTALVLGKGNILDLTTGWEESKLSGVSLPSPCSALNKMWKCTTSEDTSILQSNKWLSQLVIVNATVSHCSPRINEGSPSLTCCPTFSSRTWVHDTSLSTGHTLQVRTKSCHALKPVCVHIPTQPLHNSYVLI